MNSGFSKTILFQVISLPLVLLWLLGPSRLPSQAQNVPGDSGPKLLRELPIDAKGTWDYLAFNPEGRRLYISNDAGIIVFDVDAERVVGNVPEKPYLPRRGIVHRVAIAPAFNRGFISHQVPPTAVIFDQSTLPRACRWGLFNFPAARNPRSPAQVIPTSISRARTRWIESTRRLRRRSC